MNNGNLKLESLNNPTENRLGQGVLGILTGNFSKLDTPSGNGRLYTREFWEGIIARPDIQSDLEEGRVVGTFIHPTSRNAETSLGTHSTAHPIHNALVTKKLWIEGNNLKGKAYILDTEMGRLVFNYLKATDENKKPLFTLYMSVRGGSLYDYIDPDTGLDVLRSNDYFLEGFDIVPIPGIKGTNIKGESLEVPKVITHQLNKLEACMTQKCKVLAKIKHELNLKSI